MSNSYYLTFKAMKKTKYWEDFIKDGRRTRPENPARGIPEKVKHICILCLENETVNYRRKYCIKCYEGLPEYKCSACGSTWRHHKVMKSTLCIPCAVDKNKAEGKVSVFRAKRSRFNRRPTTPGISGGK